MAGRLPTDLVEEAASTLSSVGRVSLPPEQWPAVERTLTAADRAVAADDAEALRGALDELRRMGLAPGYFEDDCPTGASLPVDVPPVGYGSPPPSPPVGYGSPPPPPQVAPPSFALPPPAPRAIRRRVWLGAVIVAAIALVAVAVVGLMTSQHGAGGRAPHRTSPTGSASTSPAATTSASPTETPSHSAGGAGNFVAVGLLAAARGLSVRDSWLVRMRSHWVSYHKRALCH